MFTSVSLACAYTGEHTVIVANNMLLWECSLVIITVCNILITVFNVLGLTCMLYAVRYMFYHRTLLKLVDSRFYHLQSTFYVLRSLSIQEFVTTLYVKFSNNRQHRMQVSNMFTVNVMVCPSKVIYLAN